MDVIKFDNGALWLKKYSNSVPLHPEPYTIYYFDSQRKQFIQEKYQRVNKNVIKTANSYVYIKNGKAVIISYRGKRPTIYGKDVTDYITVGARYYITEYPLSVSKYPPHTLFDIPKMYLEGMIEPISMNSYLIGGTVKITTQLLKRNFAKKIIDKIPDGSIPSASDYQKAYIPFKVPFEGTYVAELNYAESPFEAPITIKKSRT